MSSALLPRLALRQSRFVVQRRAASSTAEAANTAKEKAAEATSKASEATSKAQQGLSRVTSSAGSAMSSAGNALSGVGGRTGRLIGFVQGLIPPTVYYARVAGELGKIIYRGRSMQPPTMQTVQSYVQPLRNAVQNPSSLASRTATAAESTTESVVKSPQNLMERARNVDSATLVTAGVVAAETLGFFCIGEMIGRFKVVGYRGGHQEHH